MRDKALSAAVWVFAFLALTYACHSSPSETPRLVIYDALSFALPRGWSVENSHSVQVGSRVVVAREPSLGVIEVSVRGKPIYPGSIAAPLELSRRRRMGSAYELLSNDELTIGKAVWRRARFRSGTDERVELSILGIDQRGNERLFLMTMPESIEAEVEKTLVIDSATDKPAPTQASMSGIPGVVFLLAGTALGEELLPVSSGSGTIISANGLIITNDHVIFDEHSQRLHDFVAVATTQESRAQFKCISRLRDAAREPARDLALIRCDEDLDGHAFPPNRWGAVELSTVHASPGESVVVVGFTDGMQERSISGVITEVSTNWLAVDAAIEHGYSGGGAFNAAGELIGVTTAIREARATCGGELLTSTLIRPVALARALLER